MANRRIVAHERYFEKIERLPSHIQRCINRLILAIQNRSAVAITTLQAVDIKQQTIHPLSTYEIDSKYSLVACSPADTDVTLLLWIDTTPRALQWAEKHFCNIHPSLGTVQVDELSKLVSESEKLWIDNSWSKNSLSWQQEADEEEDGVFTSLTDEQLRSLGVPKRLLYDVKMIKTEQALQEIRKILPQAVGDALLDYFIEGDYQSLINESAERFIDPYDFNAALERPGSKAVFFSLDLLDTDAPVMESIEKWQLFLHPSQQQLAYGDKSGSSRILGNAGTGKTVVAIHRAKWLASQITNDADKVLFTTYSQHLAVDIYHKLQKICPDRLLKKIDVVCLEKWLEGILQKYHPNLEILTNEDIKESLWVEATKQCPSINAFSLEFIQEEWEMVIQHLNIQTESDYCKITRLGRKKALSTAQRAALWPVFLAYRTLLKDNHLIETEDAYRIITDLVKTQKIELHYASAIIDEAQNVSKAAFSLLRHMIPEGLSDLFIVGDALQRTQHLPPMTLKSCGIDTVGRTRTLKRNYRCTEEIRQFAETLISRNIVDELDGNITRFDSSPSLQHGPWPSHDHCHSIDDQSVVIKEYIKALNQPYNKICVLVRTHDELERVERSLKDQNIPIHRLDNQFYSNDNPAVLNVGTMLIVGGIEFDHIILASANQGVLPNPKIHFKSDENSRQRTELQERLLTYMALTRARKTVHITSYDRVSPYFSMF